MTATPDEGYRFVGWSDGESMNPRLIEVTEAMSVEALFERICSPHYIIPVVQLYEHLLLVDKHSLDSMGYTVAEQDVQWYRIVGDADDIQEEETNDILEATGYYINENTVPAGYYYVQIDAGKDGECQQILRSKNLKVGTLGISEPTDNAPAATKFIRDCMLFIRRGDNVYDMWGNIAE